MEIFERDTHYLFIDDIFEVDKEIPGNIKKFILQFMEVLKVEFSDIEDIRMSTREFIYLIVTTIREYEKSRDQYI